MRRFAEGDGRHMIGPIRFGAEQLDKGHLISNAELGRTVPMWAWIGDEAATTFSC